jgi:hypothetical protein
LPTQRRYPAGSQNTAITLELPPHGCTAAYSPVRICCTSRCAFQRQARSQPIRELAGADVRARCGLAYPGTPRHQTAQPGTRSAPDRRPGGMSRQPPSPGGTCRQPGPPTLNPRVRGSSPWRRTRPNLGFYHSRSFFMCPFCSRAGSVLARELRLGRRGLVITRLIRVGVLKLAKQLLDHWSRPSSDTLSETSEGRYAT